MQIGDKFHFTPSAFTNETPGPFPGRPPLPRELVGRVVYIHPQRRYFTVEAEVNGQKIRESFDMQAIHGHKSAGRKGNMQ